MLDADPRTNTVPDVSPATVTATDSSPSLASAQSHGLSGGAKAGIAIGVIAGAVLIASLAAVAFTKVRCSAHSYKLQLCLRRAAKSSFCVIPPSIIIPLKDSALVFDDHKLKFKGQ